MSIATQLRVPTHMHGSPQLIDAAFESSPIVVCVRLNHFALNVAMIRGYARVSTYEQNTDLQLKALREAGCAKLYKDQGVSGGTRDRPAPRRCFGDLQAGDTLVVWKLDRLARSLIDLLHMLNELGENQVGFRSVTEAIDTTTAAGRMMSHILGAFSEFERSMLRERTKSGLAAAKARGVQLGRKPKLKAEQLPLSMVRRQLDKGKLPAMVARAYGVSRSTLHLHLSRTRRDSAAAAARRKHSRFSKRS